MTSPESPRTEMITLPDHLKPEGAREAYVPEPGAVMPHQPNREPIVLELSEDQKAARLAEHEEQQRLIQAASESVAAAHAAIDAAKHEQM